MDQQTGLAPSQDALIEWTRDRVAFYLECPPETIDPGTPLTAYGFDSVFALAICGDIEDEYGLQVEPTVDAIAGRLAHSLAG